jgi:flagellar FliL protein
MLFKKKKKQDEAPVANEDEGGAAAEAEKPEAGGEGEEGATPDGAESAEELAKKKKKKLIIIIAAVVVVLLLAGAGAYFMLGGGHDSKIEADPKGMEVSKPVYFDLPQILVNLNTGGKTTSFIKTTITLQLEKSEEVPVVQANLPKLIDNYNTFLREMKATDLYGSAGVYRLREEMLTRANQILAPVKVKDVLFREILVQ